MSNKKRKDENFEEPINLNNGDLSFSSLSSNARIELFGNLRMILEGKYSILEYSEELIKIKLTRQSMLVFGRNIIICNAENNALLISGVFSRIEFE